MENKEYNIQIPEPPEGWWKLDEKDRKEVFDYIHGIGETYNGFMSAYRRELRKLIFRVRLFVAFWLMIVAVMIVCMFL